MNETMKPLARLDAILSLDPCEDCSNDFAFGFITPEGHHTLSMKDILQCFKELERQGFTTEMDYDWWLYIYSKYSTVFEETTKNTREAHT